MCFFAALIIREGAAEQWFTGEGSIKAENCECQRDDQRQDVVGRVPRREVRCHRKEDHEVQEEDR